MDKYWIVANGVPSGPVSLAELVNTPGFGPSTPVWREGLPDWTTADKLPETAALFLRTRPDDWNEPRHTYAPGAPVPGVNTPGQMPPTHLVWAILSTLCCCLPFGIVAIVYASRVAPCYERGDYAGAKRASEQAGWWVLISFVTGLIWAPFSILMSLFAM